MVQLYIKHTDNNFYLLDLEDSEVINLKITVKDLNDITKVFSPFTQAFNIKATDKNKILCGFVGNEKIKKTKPSDEFDAMIYISGFFYQSGKLKFEKSSYKNQDQKSFKTNFASTLTGLNEILGETTIQDLFKDENGDFDDAVKIVYGKAVLKNRLSSIKAVTLSNGIPMSYGIPFISNNRVWQYNPADLNAVDNIAYRQNRPTGSENQIMLNEVRPAIDFMCIMKHLLLKIGSPVVCPLFNNSELYELFVWCSSENLVSPETPSYILQNYQALNLNISVTNPLGSAIPTIPKWQLSLNQSQGVFTIQRTNSSFNQYFYENLTLALNLNNLTSLDGQPTKFIVSLTNADTNVIIDSQELTNISVYRYNMQDQLIGSGGVLRIRFEILPVSLISWSSIAFSSSQTYFRRAAFVTFFYNTINNTDSASPIRVVSG